MALEVDVIDVNWLSPKSTKSEVDSLTELGWVWVSVSLAFIHKEVTITIGLSENHGVSDWCLKLKGLSKSSFN